MNRRTYLSLAALLVCLPACSEDNRNACYSPTSNLSRADETGAVGCACNPAVDQDVCVQGKGLMCTSGHWQAVLDGPCMPLPQRDAATDQQPAGFDSATDEASHDGPPDSAPVCRPSPPCPSGWFVYTDSRCPYPPGSLPGCTKLGDGLCYKSCASDSDCADSRFPYCGSLTYWGGSDTPERNVGACMAVGAVESCSAAARDAG